MLKSKGELEHYLEEEFLKIALDTKKCTDICNFNYETFNIPRSLTSDYITLRNSLVEANEFILFTLLTSAEHVNEVKLSKINFYFNEKEIKMYSTSKFIIEKIKFPLRFKAIQITEDQWISKIDFNTLMQFRAAQIINYNENTQRNKQSKLINGKEYYINKPNTSAIESIVKLYKDEIYIPTAITLNIPVLEDNADFEYDEEESELVIKSLNYFDVLDGYHRYLAACKVCDNERDFNYSMELRIVNFSEEKAQQFIYQEDQKTKMLKSYSDTLDQTSMANQIVNELNINSRSCLQGLVNRNKPSIIQFSELADLIKYFFLNKNKEKKNSIKKNISNELIEDFNMLTDHNSDYLDEKYSYKKLVGVMYCFNYFRNKDKSQMCNIIEKLVEELEFVDNKKFYSRKAKKSMMNEVESIFGKYMC